MKNHSFSLNFFAFLILYLVACLSHLVLAGVIDRPNYGEYRPIEDIHSPHVTKIANFAVSEMNKQVGKKLVFENVVKGETQVVSGVNYKLVIMVKDEATSSSLDYECVVWEKVWLKFRKLTSFHEVKT